ncbi:MAG: sodium:proton antiporter [Clostridia bacterium]|nr:sodium:proton antiporter [Clostridia bacterium]
MFLIPVVILLPMVMAVVSACVSKRSALLRDGLVVGTGIATFALCVLLLLQGEGTLTIPAVCGFGLTFEADGFRTIYACIAAFMWMMSGIFSPEYFSHHAENRGRYGLFNLLTLGATLGVFYSADLYTTFIFFEIMSVTSFVMVAHEETPGAMRAAYTYLAVAVIGGMTTLMGLFLLYKQLGTLSFEAMAAAKAAAGVDLTAASWLVVVGFAAKAGLYPLHIWLPKAHPVAPAPASALLSGILTKSGVFGLIVVCSRLMAGDAAFGNLLMIFACITMFLGALLALFSVDLKRTLACSSMSQIGFITVGLSTMVLLGEHGSFAAYGAVMHMANHSLIKLVLFMAAGVVYMNTHSLDLNVIRGYGRKKYVLHACFLLGALSIACIPPLGSGYNSKSLLHEAMLELIVHLQEHGHAWLPYKAAEILFLISGGLTIAYMVKLYICIFWQKNPERQAEYDASGRSMNPVSALALIGSAIVLPFLGAMPATFLTPLGDMSAHFFGQHAPEHHIDYFCAANLEGAAISITIGAAVYLLIVRPLLMKKNADGVREYVNIWPAKVDLENALYRPLIDGVLNFCGKVMGFVAAIPDSKFTLTFIPRAVTAIVRGLAELPERIVYALRKTVFSASKAHQKAPVGNRFTYTLGTAMNAVARLLNRVFRKDFRTDFEYVLDASWTEARKSTGLFSVSVSFGLLLLCAGLYVTFLYLLR